MVEILRIYCRRIYGRLINVARSTRTENVDHSFDITSPKSEFSTPKQRVQACVYIIEPPANKGGIAFSRKLPYLPPSLAFRHKY